MSAWEKMWFWRKADDTRDNRPWPLPLQQVDVSADLVAAGVDVDYSSNPFKAIYVGDIAAVGPLVYVKMHEDSAFFVHDCVKGMRIEGIIVGVGFATTARKLVGLR